jgi:uncharacterized secreted protein with C-terminal beta-propeller domain
MRRVAIGVAGVAALGLVAGSLWAAGQDGTKVAPPETLTRTQAVAALTPVGDCDALLKHLKDQAREVVGPFGLGGTPIYTLGASERMVDSGSASDSSASAPVPAAAAKSAPDSTTNVQVAGVDESDVVKTDGDLMLAVVNGELKIVRLNDGGTDVLATWSSTTSSAESVLVDGSRAVVIGTTDGLAYARRGVAAKDLMPAPTASEAVISLLDLSNPENPRLMQQFTVDGALSGSVRLVDGELRFALSSSPSRIPWKQPDFTKTEDPRDQRKLMDKATAANRKVLAATTIDDWLPRATVVTGGQRVRRDLVDCRNVSMPRTYSGLQTLSLVQIPLDGGTPLSSWRSAGVLASDSTLYATADHAWLATQQWAGVADVATSTVEGRFAPVPGTTQIHVFDTPRAGQPVYRGSGSVRGNLINQFAMDEQGGVLRVATTVDGGTTDNRVTTLRLADRKLVTAGEITGLGQGERIRGVRFMGDVGYVVTFRQTDPLYTIDLADPAKPVLRGQLKIPGYSAYLHPAGPGRILGLGQDGTGAGQSTGLQLSLFDVSGADATRLDRVRLPGAWSDAESDHHAFTMTGNLVLVPYSGPAGPGPENPATDPVAPDGSSWAPGVESGVLAVRVYGSSIGEPHTLVTPANPLRAVVSDGDVYTLTPEGVAVHRPDGNGFTAVTVVRF